MKKQEKKGQPLFSDAENKRLDRIAHIKAVLDCSAETAIALERGDI